jgi:dihydropteroate synthase
MPVGKDGRLITWGSRTWVMGILNVTPDSFSDGGTYLTPSGSTAGSTGLDISEEGEGGKQHF